VSINPNPDRRARYAAAIAEGFRAFDADTTSDAYLDADLLDAVVAVADADQAELLAAVSVVPPATNQSAEARVRALHQEYAFGDDPQVYCAHCNQISGGWIPWPCPTVQALAAESAVVPPPATNQTALRDRIRRAVCEAEGFAWDSDMLEPDEYGDHADMVLAALFGPVPAGTDIATWTAIRAIQLMNEAGQQRDAALAVLPAPVDRAATLREAEAPPALCVECSHAYAAHQEGDDPVSPGSCAECPDEEWHDYDGPAETQPTTKREPEPEAVCVCGHPTRQHFEDACLLTGCGCADVLETSALPEALEAVLTKRFTELGNPFSRMSRHEQGPDGWPASHPVGPHHVAEVLRELLAAGRSADGRPELRLPRHTVNEAEAPDAEADGAQRPAPRDYHRAAWNALTPQRQAAYLAGLDNAGVRQDEVEQAGGPSRGATEPQPTAYSDGKGRVFCTACPRPDAVDVPLTVEDVDPWELCPSCGRHVVDVARAAAPAVSSRPGTEQEARPAIPCNAAHLRVHHAPHGWEPQPGMDPVHCPGFTKEQS